MCNFDFKTFDKVLYRLTPMEPWKAGFYCDCDQDRHYVIGVGKDECPCDILRYEDYSYLLGTTLTPAPEQKNEAPIEHKLEPYEKVLHRPSDDAEWLPGLYSRMSRGSHYVQSVAYHQQVIPYEGNEHLLGTRFNPGQKNRFEYGDKVEITDTRMEHWREALYLHGCTDGGGHSVYDREARMISWASDSCIRHAQEENK